MSAGWTVLVCTKGCTDIGSWRPPASSLASDSGKTPGPGEKRPYFGRFSPGPGFFQLCYLIRHWPSHIGPPQDVLCAPLYGKTALLYVDIPLGVCVCASMCGCIMQTDRRWHDPVHHTSGPHSEKHCLITRTPTAIDQSRRFSDTARMDDVHSQPPNGRSIAYNP